MSQPTPRRLALAAGLLGGLAASLVMIGAGLIAPPAAAPWGDYGALAVAMLAFHAGSRASARVAASFRERLTSAGLGASALGAVAGLGALLLFTVLRPGLLAARYAAYLAQVHGSAASAERVARELARLAATRSQYLDASFQALSFGASVCFFGLLVGGYGAWRVHVARRLGRAAPAR